VHVIKEKSGVNSASSLHFGHFIFICHIHDIIYYYY